MKTVTVDGTMYTKAKDVADAFGYTSDYLGQLCRANKIDCQLVGRSWYVSIESVEQHKESKHPLTTSTSTPSTFNSLELSTNKDIAPVIEVRPVLSKNVIRSTPAIIKNQTTSAYRPARYFSDEQELLPRPARKISPLIIPIPHTESSVAFPERDISDVKSKKISVDGTKALPTKNQPLSLHLTVQSTEISLQNKEVVPTSPSLGINNPNSHEGKELKSEDSLHHRASVAVPPKQKQKRREVVVITSPRQHTSDLSPRVVSEYVAQKPKKQAKQTPKNSHPVLRLQKEPSSPGEEKNISFTPKKVVFSPQSITRTPSVAYQLAVFSSIVGILGLLLVSYFGVLRLEVDETSSRSSIQLQLHFNL
jgi:hypothetical protein